MDFASQNAKMKEAIEAKLQSAVEAGIEIYRKSAHAVLKKTKVLSEKNLSEEHQKSQRKAIEEFHKRHCMSDKETPKPYLDQLEKVGFLLIAIHLL